MSQSVSQKMGGLAITKGPGKLPPANFPDRRDGICSVYPIRIQKGAKAYRYDVEIIRNGTTTVSITKGSVDDGARSLNRLLCNDLLTTFYSKTRGFGSSGKLDYVYDGRKNLFTNMEIKLPLLAKDEVEILLQRSEAFELDLCDFRPSLTADVASQANRDLRTFLELLTSQHAVNSKDYASVGVGKLFENNRDLFTFSANGLVIRTGVAKGVRIIENNGNPCPALVVDVKKCAFFAEQCLAESARAVLNGNGSPSDLNSPGWRKFLHLYKGVRVYLNYAPHRSFVIESLSREQVKNLTTKSGPNQQPPISLKEYYKKQYNITLTQLDWPAVRNQTGNPFPLELCLILPNQRVPIEKMETNLSRDLLKLNTVKPFIRHKEINEQLRNIQVSSQQNMTLKNFGVSVDLRANQVPIGVRQNPGIKFKDQILMPINANWMKDADKCKFLVVGQKLKWVIMCYADMRSDAQGFVQQFLRRAQHHGLEIDNPGFESIDYGFDMDKKFAELRPKNIQMVFFIDSIRNKSHNQLKLMEVKYKILTQQVTFEKAQKGGAQTIDNILMKFNQKRNGLNYCPIIEKMAERFNLNTGKVLVLGYDVAHPGPMSPADRKKLRDSGIERNIQSLEPSVVGITGNVTNHPHNFVGDYFYQESRREAVDIEMLKERVVSLLQRLKKNRPSPQPEYLFVIRDGVSEGQIPMVVRDELPAIRAGCREFSPDFQPKIAVVVVTKKHWKRFFIQQQGNKIDETLPGSVIDTKVVRADITEFYLQSHKAILGTAKIPQYVMPINEMNATMDEIQGFLNMLCNTHQIVNSAISRPEPIYQADELAKRGRNNFIEFRNKYPNAVPKDQEHPDLINFKALNSKLQYDNHPLSSFRYTA